jgi:hypothetical protein
MKRSVYDYYPLALAEGEGAGTAYEYYVKAQLLQRVLKEQSPPRLLLVGGLPEKYGLSMDFALLAQDLNAEVLFLDERPARLSRFSETYDNLADKGLLGVNYLKCQAVADITDWNLADRYDLALCCEVLQRLDAKQQSAYFSQLNKYAKKAVVFAPNGGNPQHAGLSGLRTVTLDQLLKLAEQNNCRLLHAGLLDLPPFPPGITRSETKRQDAVNSPLQRFLFWGINVWADAERMFPSSIKKSMAHIIYGVLDL